MTRAPFTPNLFGPEPPIDASREREPVTIPLRYVSETAEAFLLKPDRRGAAAAWVPKRLAKRGEGPEAGLYTMARGIARERGWLA